MIRINLLRTQSSRRQGPHSGRSPLGLYLAVLFLVVATAMGWWYRSLIVEERDSRHLVVELEQENARLLEVRAELERYQSHKSVLDERIAVIERLKINQTGPVNLMNAIISSIPDQPRLWLTSLGQTDRAVTIEGRALDVPSIADFIAALNSTPPFYRVDLKYWQDSQGSIRFALNCELRE